VIDPRRTDLVRSPHVEADYHLPLRPGTNVAVLSALAHVIVTEGLVTKPSCANAAIGTSSALGRFRVRRAHSPEFLEPVTGVPAEALRGAARLLPRAATARSITAWA
jgi:formate dehydrogenase major subunit